MQKPSRLSSVSQSRRESEQEGDAAMPLFGLFYVTTADHAGSSARRTAREIHLQQHHVLPPYVDAGGTAHALKIINRDVGFRRVARWRRSPRSVP